MSKLFYFIILILSIFLFSPNKLQAQSFYENAKFKHLSVADGLSDNNVNAVLQDKEGFMWLGTSDGLNKYDGYKFTIYRHIPSDSCSIGPGSINYIYEDKEGLIWIGAEGSLSILDKKTDKFKVFINEPQNPNSISSNIVTCIIEDNEGIIWITTYGGGINKFDKKTGKFFSYKNEPRNPYSISSDYIENCFVDSHGIMWISAFETPQEGLNTKGGLNSFDKHSGKFTYYGNNAFINNRCIGSCAWNLVEDTKGLIWIGSGGNDCPGLSVFDKEKKEVTNQFIHDPKDKNSLSNNIVQCLYDDAKGYLWAGTLNGLNILDKNTNKFTVFKNDPNNSNSLSNNSIKKIYQDNQGLIWIGTAGGGVNIYDRNYSSFIIFKNDPNNKKSINSNLVFSIYEGSKGLMWIGTAENGLTSFDKTTGEFNCYKGEITYDGKKKAIGFIGSIQGKDEEHIWLGIPSNIVLSFNCFTKKYAVLPPPFYKEKNDPIFILGLCADSKQSLWVGTPDKLTYFNFPEKKRSIYLNNPANPNSISENFITNIFEDSQNNIWVSTRSKGLNVFEINSGNFFCFINDLKKSNSLSSNAVNTLYEAPNGVYWLGTNGSGLDALILQKGKNKYISGYKFYHFTDKDGLPNNIITGILPDSMGNIWIGTNQGICKFTPPKYLSSPTINSLPNNSEEVLKSDKPFIKNYDLNDGLPSNSFTGAACKTKDGLMYFGSSEGLVRFQPDSLKNNPHKPPVYLTSFKIFEKDFPLDTPIAVKHEIVLTYKQNFFSFEFVALDYAQPSKNQYAFMMEGFDNKWVYSGKRRYASYTNLDPGEYIFRVKASNNNALWNEEGASIRIVITPPFWRTKTFYVICILTLIIITFGYIKWRERNLKREKRILEDKVALRTKQLEEKNKIVEEQKNVVEEKNIQITESINYAKRIQNALLPSQELFKSFSNNSFIFFRPKDIVSGDFYYFLKFEKYTLLACVDCTGHGVPGGFMSTLGSLLLDKIVNSEILSPSEILNKLSDEIIRVLHQQDGGEIQDGMDLSICLIDRSNKKIEFSGARNGIIIITDGQAKRYKADLFPVGGNYIKKGIPVERNFKTQTISINQNDWIYMYTDGFMEQVGGAEGVPMNYTQFEDILTAVSNQQSQEEKNMLLQTKIDDWMGNHQRDDDILIIGFHVT